MKNKSGVGEIFMKKVRGNDNFRLVGLEQISGLPRGWETSHPSAPGGPEPGHHAPPRLAPGNSGVAEV